MFQQWKESFIAFLKKPAIRILIWQRPQYAYSYSCRRFMKAGIFMNAVDTGWVTDEDPRWPKETGTGRFSTTIRYC
jgi:hypothetical protein